MKKRNFSAEFKRESAQLVVDQNYTVADAAKAMNVGSYTLGGMGTSAQAGNTKYAQCVIHRKKKELFW